MSRKQFGLYLYSLFSAAAVVDFSVLGNILVLVSGNILVLVFGNKVYHNG